MGGFVYYSFLFFIFLGCEKFYCPGRYYSLMYMQQVIALNSVVLYSVLFQARKRKLGLLEDDDNSQLDKSASSADNSTGAGKNRGMLILNVLLRDVFLVKKLFFIGSNLSFCYF